MSNILTQIVDNKILEIDKLKTTRHSELDSESKIANQFITKSSKLQIIAEIKPKSPSAGVLIQGNPIDLVAQFNQFASGISVLTDNKFFGGSFQLLSQVRARTKLPILCKEFILDPIQIDIAKESGANIILLIVRILDPQRLKSLLNYTLSLGLQLLLEVNTKRELEIALEVIQSEQILNRVQNDRCIIGINNRNLATLELNLHTSLDLIKDIPDEFIKFSLSGIKKTLT